VRFWSGLWLLGHSPGQRTCKVENALARHEVGHTGLLGRMRAARRLHHVISVPAHPASNAREAAASSARIAIMPFRKTHWRAHRLPSRALQACLSGREVGAPLQAIGPSRTDVTSPAGPRYGKAPQNRAAPVGARNGAATTTGTVEKARFAGHL
jgi:hypothetical protein